MASVDILISQLQNQMRTGRIKKSTINMLIRKEFDGNIFEEFLSSDDENVRMEATLIVGEKGDAAKLVELIKDPSKSVALRAVKLISNSNEGLEALVTFLNDEDVVLREEAISSLHKAGQDKYLTPLLFSSDVETANRVKRYIQNAKENQRL